MFDITAKIHKLFDDFKLVCRRESSIPKSYSLRFLFIITGVVALLLTIVYVATGPTESERELRRQQREFYESVDRIFDNSNIPPLQIQREGRVDLPTAPFYSQPAYEYREYRIDQLDARVVVGSRLVSSNLKPERFVRPPYGLLLEPWYRLELFTSEHGYRLLTDRQQTTLTIEGEVIPFYKTSWVEPSEKTQNRHVTYYSTWYCKGEWGAPTDQFRESSGKDESVRFIRFDITFYSESAGSPDFEVFLQELFRNAKPGTN